MNRVALQMLVGDRGKHFGVLLGITFACLLITLVGSMFTGIMYRFTATIRDAGDADIWVMDPKVQFIDDIKPLPDTDLWRVRTVPGIAWAVPFYKGNLRAKLPDGSFQNCAVFGIDDASLAIGPPTMIDGRLADLRQTDTVIVDERGAGRKLAQPLPGGGIRPLQVGDTLELNDHRAVVAGICRVSRTFQSLPTIYTTYKRAMAFAPRERKQLSFVLAKVAPGADPAAVCRDISERTGLMALTADQFKRKSVIYFLRNTPIPVNVGLMVVLSFVVGTAITGLSFNSFVLENLRYFGALKAMGAGRWLLVRMTLIQAGWVGGIGYGIGTGLATLICFLLRNTEAEFRTPGILLLISAAAVLVIVSAAALFSLRKVMRLEPAIVFRS
jgi:putative ABC transport system permease protein